MTKDVTVEAVGHHGKDYVDPPPAPFFDIGDLALWSFYRMLIAEFIATLLFLYATVATVISHKKLNAADQCDGVGILGIAWVFGGMIFILVYCTAGISGGHTNPLGRGAVPFGESEAYYGYNAGLIRDSRNQVEYLENEVRLFKAFLKDFSRVRMKDTVAEAFAREVHGVVSDADGVIVRYLNRKAEIRHRNFFQRAIAGPVGLIDVAKEVRAMRARVKVMYGKSVAIFASQRTVRPPAG